jgi:hypothetical protein
MLACVINVCSPCFAKWSITSPLPTPSSEQCGIIRKVLNIWDILNLKEFQVSAISCLCFYKKWINVQGGGVGPEVEHIKQGVAIQEHKAIC